ncbi:D-alanyl-D-alanine carboxypeptidase [Pedobacter faecalis]|uniref:D-alanyl-D-alanine carboxypeptidase n=1 Tax=Pedobacter faecalis TaxID=3041495 RepID=UPI00254BFD6B|nr:D-alanyl-D-alanine carboxypeptidase [Pedobacter sp. ELA7]
MFKIKLKYRYRISAAAFALLAMPGCSVQYRGQKEISGRLERFEQLTGHHAGFALYDSGKQKMVAAHQADKYFTPASNMKLLTMYAALKLLPDSLPALRYQERGDSLVFWGTGDPSFLHARLEGTKAASFLVNSGRQLFFAPGRHTGAFYGRGWQWDDYNDDYQAEINEFPVMGNVLSISAHKGKLQTLPRLFQAYLAADSSDRDTSFHITRAFTQNSFTYPPLSIPPNYTQQLPYKLSHTLTLALLSDTLKKRVTTLNRTLPADAKTLYSTPTKLAIKEMMLPSDNFIAEQLLLVCADRLGDTLSGEKTIKTVLSRYLSDLPDKPVWVDGSGLTRYNLITPRSLIEVLKRIRSEFKEDKALYDLLPAGGNRGTLKAAYPATDKPFVFGKTGSFSNNYNQAGYIVTKKGNTYLFAFMNNNFVKPTAQIRAAIADVVTYVYEKM